MIEEQTNKASSLFQQIRIAVAQIPYGKVATYGDVAAAIGTRDARKVGWAVYGNQDPNIPCHRVVRKDGSLAEKFSLGGWQEQKVRLEAEGITFISEMKVDMERHQYSF